MRSRPRGFRAETLTSFTVIIVLLIAGMAFALIRTDHVTTRQLLHVQTKEYEITLVERLRGNGEVLVAAGRAYLIAGDPAQLANLNRAGAEFEKAVRALEATGLSPKGLSLLDDVREAATRLERAQDQLVKEGRQTATSIERFETELLPARVALRTALERLVGHKTAVIESMYTRAAQERTGLTRWMFGLLATLAVVSLGVAWLSARRLERMYRRETDALDTARQAMRARDELVGIVAHDLRSPLGAISMRAELLEKTTKEPETRDHASAINNTATRMATLIKTLLDVNVIEAGQLTVETSPCHVDRLVGDAYDTFSRIAAFKHIEIEQEVPDSGLVVLADRERISQVLANLLGNAIKFTPTHGRVTLSAVRSGDLVAFAVTDTGPGIPDEHLRHVFDRYWKDDQRGTKGTGLGLFIANSIIDAHGSRLSVESSPNHGVTFRFWLPLAAALIARPSTSPESRPARSRWQTS